MKNINLSREGVINLNQWITDEECHLISPPDQHWLAQVFAQYDGYPSLEQVWMLMDKPWRTLNCDPAVMDGRIGAYYSHPVWLLNGLFIEQHAQSLANRKHFADWVLGQSPRRVAEFGGGFGGLARMIGQSLPTANVEVIEPHPHPVAIARADKTPNVRYQPTLTGVYDVIVATDVFEHVPDPLQLVADTACHLQEGGCYLIANCFAPVILCHLPQTFHFRHSWDAALRAMGLVPAESVAYGRVFVRRGALNLAAARAVEQRSVRLWHWLQHLHGRLARPLTKLLLAVA